MNRIEARKQAKSHHYEIKQGFLLTKLADDSLSWQRKEGPLP
jgi:hypothetical protein